MARWSCRGPMLAHFGTTPVALADAIFRRQLAVRRKRMGIGEAREKTSRNGRKAVENG
jgi:hypothetical protein